MKTQQLTFDERYHHIDAPTYTDGERAIWSGKTNKFTTDAATTEYMNSTFAEEIFEENFCRDKLVLLFGERMAPKTQKGAMSRRLRIL